MEMTEHSLLLVDSYAQIYRGFHAVRGLSTSAGVPVNAVFAMAKFLLKLHRDFPSARGAFVFDKGKPAFRLALVPEYKANRPPMPEELRSQIPVIKELIAAFGWPSVEYEGFEADDLIASIAKAAGEDDVLIFSADKDIHQIIDERISMMVPEPNGELKHRGIAEVKEKFGVAPARVADYLALIGDAADNIPGVEGIGPKTAAKLLDEYGSALGIQAHAAEIKQEKLRERLQNSRELIEKNLKMVLLETTPPEGVAWEPDNMFRKPPDIRKIREIAEEMELKSILKDLAGLEEKKEPQMTQMSLF